METEFLTLIISLVSLGGVVVGITRSIDRRLALLRSQINELEKLIGLAEANDVSKLELLELRINGNKELIEHRTTRFQGQYRRIEFRLSSVENFLAKTTDFVIRERD